MKVNYELRLNSFQDRIIDKSTGFGSSPIKFLVGVGNVIKAWDLAIMQMRPGEKRFLVVPPEYGYGSVAQGGLLSGIPPDSKLYFVIELVGTEELKKLNDEQSLSGWRTILSDSILIMKQFGRRFFSRQTLLFFLLFF